MHGENDAVGRLRVLRAFSVAKRQDTPNEDRWFYSIDETIVAISDGASVSFDPAPWAEVLTGRFALDHKVSLDWLEVAAREYRSRYDPETMPWMFQAAFDQGSFATLLGIVFTEDGSMARAFAFGDSLLVLVQSGEVVRTIPYEQADQFERAPHLLSTSTIQNAWLSEESLAAAWYDLDLSILPRPTLLLLTDALGQWLLNEPSQERVSKLIEILDEASFVAFVEQERSDGRMKRDDTTMIVIGMQS